MINFSFDVAQAKAVFEHIDRAKVLVFVLKVSFLCVLCHLVGLSPPALLQHLRVAGSSAAWGWSPQDRVRPDSRAPHSPLLGPHAVPALLTRGPPFSSGTAACLTLTCPLV